MLRGMIPHLATSWSNWGNTSNPSKLTKANFGDVTSKEYFPPFFNIFVLRKENNKQKLIFLENFKKLLWTSTCFETTPKVQKLSISGIELSTSFNVPPLIEFFVKYFQNTPIYAKKTYQPPKYPLEPMGRLKPPPVGLGDGFDHPLGSMATPIFFFKKNIYVF